MRSVNNNRPVAILVGMIMLLMVISCSLSGSTANEEVSPPEQTDIAGRVHQTQTVIAAQVETENAAPQPSPQPTYTYYPTYTSEPDPSPGFDPTATLEQQPAAPALSSDTPPGQFTMQVQKSTNEFYCTAEPKEITFTLTVSEINLGFAIYYHFVDLNTGKKSSNFKADIHRDAGETYRFITLLGDPSSKADYYSVVVSLPSGMGPSKLVYQIIADDNSYRTAQMEDVKYYPCNYTKP